MERASRLLHPNLILLDMHGEYSPLTEGDSGFAQQFRIAGPGDLDKPGDNVIFLALLVAEPGRDAFNDS